MTPPFYTLWIAQFLTNATVHVEHRIGDHSPLTFELDFQLPPRNGSKWRLPQSWAQYAPNADNIAYHYKKLSKHFVHSPISSSNDVTEALSQWSQHVEQAIDLALQDLHHADPSRHPWNGLPNRFKGRCQLPQCNDALPPTSVGGDRPGGYNPPCEIFSLQPKLKVCQVRRLTSLVRSIKACPANRPDRAFNLQLEWNKILTAKGYCKSWGHWILGFEALPYLPEQLPSLDVLDVAVAITRVDCDYACHHEYQMRQQSFKYRMSLDKHDDFSKLTYKLMKSVQTPFLQEVPAQHSIEATFCRSSKGLAVLRLIGDKFPSFTVHAHALFGNASIQILAQDGPRITFKLLQGVIPTKGLLVQEFIASSDEQVFHEFHKFWQPYWQGGPVEDQFTDDCCQAFITELQDTPLPDFPKVPVPLNDVQLWMEAIAELKNHKAIGICAWRHEEL